MLSYITIKLKLLYRGDTDFIVNNIDAMGLPCPMPVVQAKKALEQSNVNAVTIKVDNFIAVQNLEKMAHGLGYEFTYNKVSDSEFHAVLTKKADGNVAPGSAPDRGVDESLNADEKMTGNGGFGDGVVIAFGSEAMGNGDEELGRALMKSFIYSLTELDEKPKVMLFFNSGAFLTADDSGALNDLRFLAESGTRILTCGACLNYYKLTSPTVGEVTNMIEMATIMSGAKRLISL